jgi:hypothetical protein
MILGLADMSNFYTSLEDKMTKSSEIDSKPQLMRQQYDEYKSDFDKCTKKIQELNT